MSEEPTLRIAIIGAGIAGLTTAIALRKLSGVHVQIYERATELRELGQAIAIGPNGLRTLEKLGVNKVFEEDFGSRCPSGFPQTYRHWQTNEVLARDKHSHHVEPRHHMTRFYRPHLQEALLEYLPKDIIHLKKRVTNVVADTEHGVDVSFADETTIHVDLLVGADGINSGARKAFAPDFEVKWSGMVAYRSAFDAKLLDGIPDVPEDSTQFVTERHVSDHKTRQRHVWHRSHSSDKPSRESESDQENILDDFGDVTVVRDLYKNHHPVIKSIMEKVPDVRVYPNFYGGFLDSYVFENRVVLVGDAAHSHGGALAANASLGMDDGYCLYLSLLNMFNHSSNPNTDKQSSGSVKSNRHGELARALELYNTTRMQHASQVLKYVHGLYAMINQQLWHNKQPISDEMFRAHLSKGGPDVTWVYEHDVTAAFEEVLKTMSGEA